MASELASNEKSYKTKVVFYTAAVASIVFGLYASNLHSYILFHSLIELTTIAIAFSIFILTWNTRRFLTDGCLKVLGIGYGLIALVDLIHALAYKGMGVFPAYGANLPTQLWIAARSLQALILCVAPFFARRDINEKVLFGISLAAVSATTALVFSGVFPDCFIEGKGLTPFKIVAEYVISAFLLLALFLFIHKRRVFNAGVFTLIVVSVLCTIGSELAFTSYLSVYGPANMVGHFLKLAAFCLIYRALVVTGLSAPFDLIFRELKQTEENLRRHQDTLEEQVRERTASLQAEVAERKRAEESLLRLNRELRAITNCNEVLVRVEDEQTLLDEICRIVCDEAGYRMAWVGYAENDDEKSVRPVAHAGIEEGYLLQADIVWADTGRGRGPTGIAIRTGKTDCMRDFTTDPKAAPWREKALQRGYRSSIALPLKDESGDTFGALTIYSTEPKAFAATEEVHLLEELAGDMAFGITVLRARNARREAERRIALLSFALDNVRESAFLIDESARFLYVNEEACHGLSYSRDELLRLGVPDVNPDFPRERWPGHWDELKERGSITFEGRHRTKDGRIFPVEISANYFEYERQAYDLALVRDITERKRVEDTLRFIAQRGWAGTADTFLTALAGYLADTLGMDYVLIAHLRDDGFSVAETSALYAKGGILPNIRYELKGTPCENVIGNKLCLYPKGVQALFPDDTLLADMGVESYAGIPLWDSAGRPIGLLAALDGRPFHDENMFSYILQLAATSAAAALERERDDRLLTAREREFRTLAENSPDCILRYDNGCRCIYANPRIENAFRIPAGGMLGKTPMELFPSGEYREYQDRIEEVLGTGADADLEVVVTDGGEGVRHHHVRFTAERDREGAITGVLVIGRDITERRRADEERTAHLRFLENMDRINRAIQRTNYLEEMMSDVLDVVLSIFRCDRAYLMYPCDPEAESWELLMERTTPEYPGAKALGVGLSMDGEVAANHSIFLASEGPVKLGHGTSFMISRTAAERFSIRSMMVMAVRPKVGKPWVFGIHQCSYDRVWNPDEERLLKEIGRRLEDALTSLLAHRELRESEENLQRLNEELDQRVKERTAELEAKNAELQRLNKLFVGRELRMVELKEKIRELEGKSGK